MNVSSAADHFLPAFISVLQWIRTHTLTHFKFQTSNTSISLVCCLLVGNSYDECNGFLMCSFFIQVLSRSRLHEPIATTSFMRGLCPAVLGKGELGYFITTLEATLLFIESKAVLLNTL
jgi:hypothetical protein